MTTRVIPAGSPFAKGTGKRTIPFGSIPSTWHIAGVIVVADEGGVKATGVAVLIEGLTDEEVRVTGTGMPALPPGEVATLFVSTLTEFPVPSVKKAWRVAPMPELEIFCGPKIEPFMYSVIVLAVGSSRPTLLAAVSANQILPPRSLVMEFGFVPLTTVC